MGAAGVTAASTLAVAGRRILAVDALDRIGGRVKTVPFGDGLVEEGAEWVHGTHPSRVYSTGVEHNITLIPQDLQAEMYLSDGSTADQALIGELLAYSNDILEHLPENSGPVGQYITNKLKEYLKDKHPDILKNVGFVNDFLEFLNLFVIVYQGATDWNEANSFRVLRPLEGHQYVSWHKYGYKTFFDLLLRKYNNGPGFPSLDIKLNTEVTQIKWSEDPDKKVEVTTKNGTVYTADNVLVTLSVAVLKERHATLFSPKLPEDKIDAIDHIPAGVIDKIILSFEQPWWPTSVSTFAFLWKDDDRKKVAAEDIWTTKIFGANRPLGCKNCLVMFISGDNARLEETVPEEEEVKNKAMDLFRKFMGANYTITEPNGIIRSTWHSNPFTRCSYSFNDQYVNEHPDIRNTLGRPLLDTKGHPRVLFAGEATDPIHFSTVHGASDSGYKEATRILQKTV